MTKKVEKKTVTAFVEVTLSLGVPMGVMTLEDALVKARTMVVTDFLDLDNLEHNDSELKVTGVYL